MSKHARIRRDQEYKSTCSYCGVGCGIIIRKDRDDRLIVEGDPDHPVNRGMLCSKGANLHHVVQDTSDRLLYPMMRPSRNHDLQRVSWTQAMQRAAAVFKSIIRNDGPDAVGFYVSGQCLTEEYYVVNKLVKGFLGTNNIDTNSRLCMSSAVAGHTATLGEDLVPICYDDIEASDCMLIAGANPAWCHPILFRRMENHKRDRPSTRIIVVDPRRTQTSSIADLHLPIHPGTDIYLYHAIARAIIENGDANFNFIQNHTEDFDSYRDIVMKVSVEKAAEICGVPIDDILLAASWIGAAKGFLNMWAMGLNQSVIGVKKNLALISLNLLTGQIGKPGAGPFSLTGQPNAMGGREVGGLATQLAAHRSLANEKHRAEVEAFWGVKGISSKPGLTAPRMIEALEQGKLKALWIICTNPMVSWPDASRAEAALRKAKFLVVQDISSRSETVPLADLVLPAAGHLEKDGTMTNSERRVGHLSKVLDPPGEARPDAEIICSFAQAMGFIGFSYRSAADIYREHVLLTKGTQIDASGISHERLIREGTMQWPVTSVAPDGTARLFTDGRFATPSAKARFPKDCEPENISDPVTPEFPLVLTTGRIRDQWHTMTKTGKVNRLRKHISRSTVSIHPHDAEERAIANGDIVEVKGRHGLVRLPALITNDVRSGVVFIPMHWGKTVDEDTTRTNNLTSGLFDPVSHEPDFKFTAVEVTHYKKSRERILVVGAGAAAYRFICSYRALNDDDDIKVISKEPDIFYNRVLLPEYVNERKSWNTLQKFGPGEMNQLNVQVLPDNEIVSIDKLEKCVTDAHGVRHHYDRLVLATGSRANLPKDASLTLPGVFTMRTRHDADRLRAHLMPDSHVLIIGGGLLGIELASSLRDIDIAVSVAQLGSRLMERQLDHLAAGILLDFVEEKGITVYMNDQLQSVTAREGNKLDVRFRSGKSITADAMVYAVGTVLNIEYAHQAGLDTRRGIVVDDHLRTSDPCIYAIGEIAEHRGKTFGITAAAEKQAEILSLYLNGDVQSTYEGTASMNILKLEGLDLCSIGLAEVPPDEKGYEEILFIDRARRYYKKCIIKDDRLVGAILVGDKTEFAEFRELIEDRIELSEKRQQLLRSGKRMEPVLGRIVCTCNQVGEGNLRLHIEGGCTSLPDLCQQSGAGLGCGSCKPELQSLLKLAASTV
jgi:ferredoxin-nitrate reductase